MTNLSEDNNVRLVRVEERLSVMAVSQVKVEAKVDAMYEAFTQAKGAKWMFIALWMSAGALLVNLKTLLALIGFKVGS